MNDRRALLRAILANPAEDARRLAYADWLEEYGAGDADAARLEFVRLWYRLKPTLRSTTRTIANWLDANWPRLWPSVRAVTGESSAYFRAHGRTLAGPAGDAFRVKAYFDRGFAGVVQFELGSNWYRRFAAAFAADEPLARFEPSHYLPFYGQVAGTDSVARLEDFGEQVFARLAGFEARPSPSEKVYARLPTRPSGGCSDDLGWCAVADAMTAIAREQNGLADPMTPTEPS